MEFIVIIIGSVKNYMRASAAKMNGATWTFFTVLAMLVTWFIGLFIVVSIMLYKDAVLRDMLMQRPQNQSEIMTYVKSKDLLFPQLFSMISALGGYLLVRHLIISRSGGQPEENSSEYE